MKVAISGHGVGYWFCALSGTLGGLSISPLLFDLPDKSGLASVVGAAIGAGITVFGALWLNKSKEIRELKAIREAATEAVGLLDGPCKEIQSIHSRIEVLIDAGKTTDELEAEAEKLALAFFKLSANGQIVHDQFVSLTPVYHSCGPTVSVAHFHITTSIKTVIDTCNKAGCRLQQIVYGGIAKETARQVEAVGLFHKELNEDLQTI